MEANEKAAQNIIQARIRRLQKEIDGLIENPFLDVQSLIKETLHKAKCTIINEDGIWTVITPQGVVWDFTNPQMKSLKALTVTSFL